MKRILQAVLYGLGVVVIVVALTHIALGQSWIPGTLPVNATLDSEHRFYATIFLFVGIVILWAARDPVTRRDPIRFLALAFFMGGLARIVSISAFGLPHPLIIGLLVAELVLPPVIVWMAGRVPLIAADRCADRVERSSMATDQRQP